MGERAKVGGWMPELLREACDGDRALMRWADGLLPSWQRYLTQWVTEPVQEETRVKRAEQLAERLMLVMEAEQELPPALARGLGEVRGGRDGWARMTLNCRRTYLMAYFGARSEGARATQLGRMAEACALKAERAREKAQKAGDAAGRA